MVLIMSLSPNSGTNTIMGFDSVGCDTLKFHGVSYEYLLTPAGVQIAVGEYDFFVILSGVFTFDTDWVVTGR